MTPKNYQIQHHLKSSVKIIDPGFYTSIQDNGRYGYRRLGFPVSGPMDKLSFTTANKLVGNFNNEPALESTFKGPKLLFSGPSWVAVSGATIPVLKNDRIIEINKPFFCDLGDVLELGPVIKGVRSYISFEGGIFKNKVFGSYSQYYPITKNATIKKGEKISLKSSTSLLKQTKYNFEINNLRFDQQLEVFEGPYWKYLSNELKKIILNIEFKIGLNDRMAYRLTGSLPKNKISTPSAPVLPGTVQLTPNGDLIIVMRDGQVTGGYPRILQLTEKSQSDLSQFTNGKLINFRII
ncbi:MAG: biotin-dependent carboxyltransferase family protein [Flavobacteriaceae bacterium]|nr:biotin-dependent carboxyltransferase family protein [Flavobacteriaceae bacterium]